MTGQKPEADAQIDDLVRQAAAFPIDEDRLAWAVQRRIRQAGATDRVGRPTPRTWQWRFAMPAAMPGFALAAVLVLTPLAVARVPLGAADPAFVLLSALALGEPVLGPDPSFTGGL